MSAYEAGEVFTIDLDHPESIDWKSLTDWAMQNVEGSAETGFLNLPRERETLDRLCMLESMSQPSMATFFEQDAPSTIARRKTNLYAQAWGPPLLALPPSSVSSGDETPQFCILKSWIRANVIAPEETYSPISAREKLSMFPTPMIETAIKQMLESHILSQETRGKINPGRNYDISATVLKQLKKAGNAEKLKAAIEFKVGILDKVLIPDSGERGEYMIDCLAHDHIALVILNLLANKRCIIRPVNPPREKWGLCGDGDGAGSMYQTRKMDKRKLNFTVGVTATGEYVVGALDLPQPPRSTSTAPPTTTSLNMLDTTTLFPLWTDIHENHVPALWELSVAAVFNTLAQRPGCNPAVIAGAVKPALEEWEVELILEWGEEWGGVQRVSLGASGKEKGKAKDEGKKGNEWRVGEWWWAALGVGPENRE